MDGVINAFKSPGISSHDLVYEARKRLRVKRVGHAGTLDPGAAGVLLLLIGRATRTQDILMHQPKTYVGELTLGLTTDTGDGFGEVTAVDRNPPRDPEHIQAALPAFIGCIQQIPPMASALKRDGVPLYRLARQGIEVPREPRTVQIYRLRLLNWRSGTWPRAVLEVQCSAGTYIRSLFQDLAVAMGSVGYMSFLSRTAVGRFLLEDSVTPEYFEPRVIQPLARALDFLPAINLTAGESLQVSQGILPIIGLIKGEPVRLLAPDGRLVALAEPSTQGIPRLKKVFLTPEDLPGEDGMG